MAIKYAFPDTNLFLHFRPVDEIDWLTELKADAVKLIIAPVVLRELNRQKDSGGNKRLRSRATQAIKRLDALSSAPTLREGVEVQFQTADPQIDFARHKLSPQVPDDWLIASAIEFAMDRQEVCVISNDLGLRMKLKAHNIPAFKLADEYELPEEPDPNQKLILEQQEEIRTLKSRLPDIKLAFADGADRLHVTLARTAPVTQSELDTKMQNLRIRFPKMLKREAYSGLDLARRTVASPAATDAYNAKLDQFYSDALKYVHDCESYIDLHHRRFTLELDLVNAGTAPAEDVDVSLCFPEGVQVVERPDLPEPPEQPEPPSAPLSRGSAASFSIAELLGLTSSAELQSLRPLVLGSEITQLVMPRSNVSRPSIRKSNSYEVELNVREVKHRCSASLGILYVGFPSWQQVCSFGLTYSLLARNLPEPAHGRLNVIVKISED